MKRARFRLGDRLVRRGQRGWNLRSLLCVVAIAICLSLPIGTVAAIAQPATVEETGPTAQAEVTLDDETVFVIRDPQTADSVEERAERISQRIEQLAKDQSIPVDAIALSETEFGPAVYAEDTILFVVTEADAAGTGLTPQALAEQSQSQVQTAISDYRYERSAEYLSRAVLIVVACTVVLVLAILILANVMPQFYRWLDRQQDRWVPDVRIQNFELLTSHQLAGMMQFFTQILHFGLVSALILFYLSSVLSLFPQTRQFGRGVFGYFVGAVTVVIRGFIDFLPNLLTIVLIIFITSLVLRFTRWIFANIRRGRLRLQGFYPEWAMPTFRLMQFLIVAFAAAVIFPYLPGADSPAFQGVSIFFGLLVSLGAGGAISGAVAGFILVYTRAFREGDRIRFDDIEGFVVEKLPFVTRIRTIENNLVSVPNTALLTGKITNYTALIRENQTPLTVKTTLTLGYDVPWKLVHQTLIAAASSTKYILEVPAPHVWQTSLDDFYVSYQLRAATIQPDQLDAIYSELHQNLQDFCNEAGIEILSPHYGAMRDGNHTTIPADYLAPTYEAPPWHIASARQPTPDLSDPSQKS